LTFVCEDPVKQQCRRCHGWFDREVGFRKNAGGRKPDISSYHSSCRGCEQTERDRRKAVDPFVVKARSTIRHHAIKYDFSAAEFIQRFGWDPPRVAHLFRHAFDNTCEYCRKPYSGMRNGVWDVTIDIVDPRAAPYLETNTKVCCQTCNSEKATMTPELWARTLRYYADWERHQLSRTAQCVQLNMSF
jgi:hypothetical protein